MDIPQGVLHQLVIGHILLLCPDGIFLLCPAEQHHKFHQLQIKPHLPVRPFFRKNAVHLVKDVTALAVILFAQLYYKIGIVVKQGGMRLRPYRCKMKIILHIEFTDKTCDRAA